MSALVMGFRPGDVIDGFTVVKALGDGGFAFVYLVEKNGKRYALKVARHREASGDDNRTYARMMRELAILALLTGLPNIVQVCGHGYWPDKGGGVMYLVLEYVEGWTLAEWCQLKHPTFHEVLRVLEKMAAALVNMHSRGVLHRDLKLANVLIRERDGEPVIIDLGAATHPLAQDLTEQGLPPGTDRYRAPEQFQFLREHKEEHRARYAYLVSDEIFAYGAMLYDVLTDARPAEERPRVALNSNRHTPPPARQLNPRVPAALSDWVESLLARDRRMRPVDTEAVRREAAELAALMDAEYQVTVHLPSEQRRPAASEAMAGKPVALVPAPPRSWAALSTRVGGGLVAAAVAVGLALVLWPGEAPPSASARPPEVAVAPSPLTAGPSNSPGSAPDISTPAPARAVGNGPAETAGTQKEGSTVTTQRPESPQKVRTPRGDKQPPSQAMCRTLAFLSAVAAGCTGLPTRPEPFECPERVQKIMFEQLGWEGDFRFIIALDDRFEADARNVVFRPGAEVVGFALNRSGPENRILIPPGTKFWGRVYVDPQDEDAKETGQPAKLWVKYERAKVPGQDEVPVCVVAASGRVLKVDKDGATTAVNAGPARVIVTYPAPGAAW